MSTATNEIKPKGIFFPNLDALRFFCFLSVFLFHTWSLLYAGVKNGTGSRLFENGNLGVNFFFVLSGYLITYLLISEKNQYNKINIPKFWMRRILRIWPLYFLCVLLGFVIIPFVLAKLGKPQTLNGSPLAFLTFTSNFDYIKNGYPGSTILEVLWSIAIEEQFYFFWPVLLSIVPRRFYGYLFAAIAIGSVAFRLVYTDRAMHNFHTLSCIGDMAVGALGALASFSPKVIGAFQRMSKAVIALIYIILLAFFFFRVQLFYHGVVLQAIDRLFIAIAFLLVIMEQNYAEHSLFKFKAAVQLSKLGVISYGLYCYHELALTAVFVAVSAAGLGDGLLLNAGKLIAAFVATIIIAMLSYRFFEKPFLKLKERYSFFVKKQAGEIA